MRGKERLDRCGGSTCSRPRGYHPDPMEFVTARLRLRPLSADDIDAGVALGADARVMTWLGGISSAQQMRAWLDRQCAHWAEHGYGRFLVTSHGAFLGFAGLSRLDFDHSRVAEGDPTRTHVVYRLARDGVLP